jgi:thymidine kinase
MWPENNLKHRKKGRIEVVCGSMFSGKTEELIRRLKLAQFAKQKVEIFKPNIDTRYNDINIVSHNLQEVVSTPVPSSSNILLMVNDADVVGIDEAQFFDAELPNVCIELANQGIRVIVAGLDMDFLGKPFGIMPQLMAVAEYVTKMQAICVNCGELAYVSHRIQNNSSKLVMLGEAESYEPLCRTCYNQKII